MATRFLGVARGRSYANAQLVETFWCVPAYAEIGDSVLFYCPMAESASRHGVFAEGVISRAPSTKSSDNKLCAAYRLLHVPVQITRRFESRLTAREMKFDAFLGSSAFVRKNFQGTTFRIGEKEYSRIIKLLTAKAESKLGLVRESKA